MGPCQRKTHGELAPRNNTLVIDAQVWTVHPPAHQVATQTVAVAAAVAGPRNVSQVSQDEEHIELFIEQGGRAFSVAHRAQHELLLLLARHRAEDMAAGVVDSEQGWRYCDEVQRDLRLEENHVNVSVFRARKHLEKAGIVGAKGIIERRRGSGEVGGDVPLPARSSPVQGHAAQGAPAAVPAPRWAKTRSGGTRRSHTKPTLDMPTSTM